MALNRVNELGINDVYKDIMENGKKRLEEAVTSGNSIHSKVEDTMKDFSSNLTSSVDAEATEEKLRDLEKDDLTNLDKKVIAAIRKLVTNLGKSLDDFSKFQKGLKYEYVINKKEGVPEEDAVDEEPVDTGDSEADMMDADKEFAAPAEEGDSVKVEGKFTSVSEIYAALMEKKAIKPVCMTCKEDLKKGKDGEYACTNKDCKKCGKPVKVKAEDKK